MPRRAAQLLEQSRALIGLDDLSGRRTLTLRAGLGAVSCYLALEHGVTAACAEPERELRLLAEHIVFASGLAGRVTFLNQDDKPLAAIGDASIDLVVAENALRDEPNRRELRALLTQIRRVLRPGGGLLINQMLVADVHVLHATDDGSAASAEPAGVRLGQLVRQLHRSGFGEPQLFLRERVDPAGSLDPDRARRTSYIVGATRP